MTAVRAAWQKTRQVSLDPQSGLPVVVDQWRAGGLEAKWHDTYMPDASVGGLLNNAIEVALVEYEDPFVATFLDWCAMLGDRGSDDPRWQSVWNDRLVPLMRGKLEACAVLARAWRGDAEPDYGALVSAGCKMAEGATALNGAYDWTEHEQSHYLGGVQYALIGGDLDTVRRLLAIRRKFSRVRAYYEWFTGFLALLADWQAQAIEARRVQFDRFFDVARYPDWDPPLHGANNGNNIAAAASVCGFGWRCCAGATLNCSRPAGTGNRCWVRSTLKDARCGSACGPDDEAQAIAPSSAQRSPDGCGCASYTAGRRCRAWTEPVPAECAGRCNRRGQGAPDARSTAAPGPQAVPHDEQSLLQVLPQRAQALHDLRRADRPLVQAEQAVGQAEARDDGRLLPVEVKPDNWGRVHRRPGARAAGLLQQARLVDEDDQRPSSR